MKKFLMFILLMFLIVSTGWAKDIPEGWVEDTTKCSDCPIDKPCIYTVSAGDGCNTCSVNTWCKDEKWYSIGIFSCTALLCKRNYEIPNPFIEKEHD